MQERLPLVLLLPLFVGLALMVITYRTALGAGLVVRSVVHVCPDYLPGK